jgi:hypothetical protein
LTNRSGAAAVEKFPWLHTMIRNLKRMILGTYHRVKRKHLDNYLAEFVYQANRRYRERDIFDRLFVPVVGAKPTSHKELAA